MTSNLSARTVVLLIFAVSMFSCIAVLPAHSQSEIVIHSFTGGDDGWSPSAALTYHNGNFYGTTFNGGPVYGTVFELSPSGGGWTHTVLYDFCQTEDLPCPDGADPGGPALIFDNAGNLYGLTEWGGSDNCTLSTGCGALFELSPAGSGWTESVLYAFCTPGYYGLCQSSYLGGLSTASSLVMDSAGNFYGTNAPGAYEIEPSENGYTERQIYSIAGIDGLTMDASGNIFGVGISYSTGEAVVYELAKNAKGNWIPTILYSFTGTSPTTWGGPIFDQSGNLYMTMTVGSVADLHPGAVYKLSPGANGWTRKAIFDFSPDEAVTQGNAPLGGLTLDSAGNLYGTTYLGGAYGQGTVYELSPTPTGDYTEKILWSFNGTDGANPEAPPVFDSAGNLYGTTYSGGQDELGTIYEINLTATESTTTVVSSSALNFTFGQSVTLTATVTSSGGTPAGLVNFYNGSTPIGSGTLNSSGQVSISLNTLPAGSDSITAAYQGSNTFIPSTSNPVGLTVNMATTSTSVASSSNTAGTGQPITLSATVISQYGGSATGLVLFYSGSQFIADAGIVSSIATTNVSFPTPGTYSVTAKYAGDSNNSSSTSGSVTEKIIVSTVTKLTTTRNPITAGETVTFTASVTSNSEAPPDGETVTFYSGSSVLGTAPLVGGSAALALSSLTTGTYTITANYPGDATFAASTSPALIEVVNPTAKSATSTTLMTSLTPSIYGQKVTFTATVTNAGGAAPTGEVAFEWGGGFSVGSANISNGVATFTIAVLNADTYGFTAVYLGDTNNLGSTSTVVSQTVEQTTSSATIESSVNPSTVGESVTFTAKIKSPTVTPKGPVTFTVGQTILGTVELTGGKATLTTSSLPAGSNAVTVTYDGDSNIQGSTASVAQAVQ
jgi:uncharacterized repeat protein (TIGR03803 family)